MTAGELRDRVRFERRQTSDDGYGNTVAEWIPELSVSARVQPLRGTEAVMASRLQGVQPVLIVVRASAASRAITPEWRAVDARSGTVYAIRTATLRETRDYVDLLCEAGAAA
jgi:SPP1 family predicted phage head-tail adaptor